ncbi:hypothetical protein [Corynebacterium efficiens YS-314]|uniref:Uncharacterized protein n=1 Tax=Corynebacterium efficiens (strain DSM 44549 / YS-314 / AJ 12310 / JCM 11189 / NBRC 100395) TaxID=196164 RepID=Q8FMV5_COREF|nr:hypothetical protein [Corynebacterium efficiens YS-314]
MGDRGTHQEEGGLQHEPVDQTPVLGIEFMDRGDTLDTGIIDQDIDLESEVLQRSGVREVQAQWSPLTSAARSRAASSLRSQMVTWAPAREKARAQAAPIPEAPPVISALRPSREIPLVVFIVPPFDDGRWCSRSDVSI